MRLSPVAHEQRDEADDASALPPAGSAAALLLAGTDPNQPAVAFGMPENAATCMPTTVWWYYAGNFPPDAACDIIITNVNVPQIPMPVSSTTLSSSAVTTVTNPPSTSQRRSRIRRQQGATPVTTILVHDIPIKSANHSALIQQLAVPPGYYLLEGKSMNPASNTVYYRSSRFYVAETPDMSCLLSSPSDPTLSQNNDSSGHGATATAPASSSAGSESPLGSSEAGPSRGSMVAGAVCGIIAVFLVLGLFLLWRYRGTRKSYVDVDAAPAMSAPTSRWRGSRAVSFVFNVKRKPPPAMHIQEPVHEPKAWTPLPRTPTPAFSAAPIVRTATPAEHSEVGASSVVATEDSSQHVHFAIPTVAVQGESLTPPVMHQHPYRTASGISDGPNRMSEITTSSFDAERADLQETFDLPITPMPVRQGFMSRTSSVGSSKEVGPMALSPPAQSATIQFVTAPPVSSPSLHVPSPAPSAPRSARSNRSAGRSPGPAQMSPAFVMQLSSSRRS